MRGTGESGQRHGAPAGPVQGDPGGEPTGDGSRLMACFATVSTARFTRPRASPWPRFVELHRAQPTLHREVADGLVPCDTPGRDSSAEARRIGQPAHRRRIRGGIWSHPLTVARHGPTGCRRRARRVERPWGRIGLHLPAILDHRKKVGAHNPHYVHCRNRSWTFVANPKNYYANIILKLYQISYLVVLWRT